MVLKNAQAEESPKEVKEFTQVVAKLPVQEIRQLKKEDGTVVNFVTVEECLTALINARIE